jgi:hypothetical protein
VGPRAELDTVEKRKKLSLSGNRAPAFHPIAIQTELNGAKHTGPLESKQRMKGTVKNRK